MAITVDDFVLRWQSREGGQERANYALFLTELCDVLGVPRPEPAGHTSDGNDYVFERVVHESLRDGSRSNRRIDLYRRDAFVLEAKQSRLSGDKRIDAPALPGLENAPRGRRGADRGWDVLMQNARRQAEDYVRWLPAGHEPPPFVLVCDVGHCIEVFANFRRDGKAYDQFPDRRSFRVYMEDLRDPAVRERLARVWTDPMSLDPTRHAARVTREIAARVAKVSKALEDDGHPAEDVALFLMRVLFTMFAEDVGLLPAKGFQSLLADCTESPEIFPGMLSDLWAAMDEGRFSAAFRCQLRRFNGEFFKDRRVLRLERAEIGELLAAARHDWRDVEPAIFGTLLEQALDPGERRRLGAHYTPRAYVERLVVATVIDPLRADWAAVLATAERQKADGRLADAARTVRAFHDRLCGTRVLDPACGTGNFLYVALELMKRLEGEVLEAYADLGGQEALAGLAGHSIDPHLFLGIERNPRAAAIAELVLWIGHLQWHVRGRGGLPDDPVLRAYRNIAVRDAVLTWTGYPAPSVREGREVLPDPRLPVWPEAEFIVGNPPFIGGKDLRARLGDAYAEALWAAHPAMNDSADLVMYWWERAAGLLTAKRTPLRRFGFVTTNSITQVFQRKVVQRHLSGPRPLSLVMAIPDHPWTRQTPDAAAVRIAMTVAEAGSRDGLLLEVTRETGLDTDTPVIEFAERRGRINADLTVGVDVTAAAALRANEGVCSPGVKLHGAGFIVTPAEAEALGLGRRPGLERYIRPYRNGRDLTDRPRGVMVIDLFGLEAADVRQRFPEVYQHLLVTVKPERDKNRRATYRENWTVFGEPRRELRSFISGMARYIATVETAKHRVFQFLDAAILPDNMIVAVGLEDGVSLGVLSSRIHRTWALRAGGWLGIGNDPRYTKTRCFDPFPFPETPEALRAEIGGLAEELDALRKSVLAAHPNLTLTGLYNVKERLDAGARPGDLDDRERRILDDGLVLVMKDLHARIDAAVARAYGWPADLPEDEVLAGLVALNAERAEEEKRGLVHWLRPDYQIPRFGTPAEAQQVEADLGGATHAAAEELPVLSKNEREQTAAVWALLAAARGPMDAAAVAARFRPGRGVRSSVAAVLHALLRMGIVSSTDGGRTFAMRRTD